MDSKYLEGLTDEQKAALKKTKTREELLALIDSSGYELSADQLDAVNGGCCNCNDYCCHDPNAKQ
ncbi:MAG: hypothetical protein J6Z43_01065 [Clostridiales bacterium]|jgi:hypothetical protein|nr:hypothetical protein [Clostridiales bacterium]